MAKLSAQEYAEKHARNLKASTEYIRRGIERVSVSPTVQAAAKIDKMKARLDEAFSSGRVRRSLEAVSVAEWKNAALNKGVGRIASGIDAVQTKQVAMAGRLLAAVDAAASKVNSMPDVSLEDSINRMSTFAREMAKTKGTI